MVMSICLENCIQEVGFLNTEFWCGWKVRLLWSANSSVPQHRLWELNSVQHLKSTDLNYKEELLGKSHQSEFPPSLHAPAFALAGCKNAIVNSNILALSGDARLQTQPVTSCVSMQAARALHAIDHFVRGGELLSHLPSSRT